MKMSQAPEILAALRLMRDEAEALAQQQHLGAAREHRLQRTRARIHDLQPEDLSPHLQQAYELSLQRAEIEWLHWSHRQTLNQDQSILGDLKMRELAQEKQKRLSELPAPPALNLEEQETLLQALMCQAAVQYADKAIAQSHDTAEPAA